MRAAIFAGDNTLKPKSESANVLDVSEMREPTIQVNGPYNGAQPVSWRVKGPKQQKAGCQGEDNRPVFDPPPGEWRSIIERYLLSATALIAAESYVSIRIFII